MQRPWSRPELLLAFRIYCQQPFGKLHKSNPAIIEVATAIGRTPSAVAMKACNLANLDPDLERKGLGNASNADRELWGEFQADSELVAAEAEAEFARTVEAGRTSAGVNKGAEVAREATEAERTVKVRRVQSFFRSSVLTIYGNRCAITGLAIPQLLTASHIIPWADDTTRRANPTNGIALNAVHDRAFDRGLITLDEDLRVVLAAEFLRELDESELAAVLKRSSGRLLRMPDRFQPDRDCLAYHRERVFRG